MNAATTMPETPAAKRPGRYSMILPPRAAVDDVRVPTPLPGRSERLTERPPSPSRTGACDACGNHVYDADEMLCTSCKTRATRKS